MPGPVWGTGVPRMSRQLPWGAAVGVGGGTEGEARASGVPSEIHSQASSVSTLLAPQGLYFSLQSFALLDLNPEKAMATHSSTLAWKIPWTEGPGGLQSMGSLGVGHD